MSEERSDKAGLERRLNDFSAALAASGLSHLARRSYLDQGSRFLRWLAGDYTPRNASPTRLGAGEQPRKRSWTLSELTEELNRYERELREARLQRLTVATYLHGASVFVRWVAGTYLPRKERRAAPGLATVDDDWLDEVEIQRRVVQWLRKEGWHVVREASGREHGTDIDATRGDYRLSVEVKGHPRKTYVFGAKAGQKKRWHAGAQTRTYYGNALHSALVMVNSDPDRIVAIALPNVPDYRGLFERSKTPLDRLGIQVWFVSKDGFVDTGENGLLEQRLDR